MQSIIHKENIPSIIDKENKLEKKTVSKQAIPDLFSPRKHLVRNRSKPALTTTHEEQPKKKPVQRKKKKKPRVLVYEEKEDEEKENLVRKVRASKRVQLKDDPELKKILELYSQK